MNTVSVAITRLEESIFRPEELPSVIDDVGRLLGFDHFCLVHSDLQNPMFLAAEPTLDTLKAYAAGGWVDVDYRAAHVNRYPSGSIFLDHVVVGEAERRKSDIYNALYKPNAMAYFAGWRLEVAASTWIYSLARAEEKGPVGPDEVEVLRRIMPFANRALQIGHDLRNAHVRGIVDGLVAANIAAVVLNEYGKAMVSTPLAEALFDADFAVRNGRLWAADGDGLAALNALVHVARGRHATGIASDIVVRRGDGRRPILVQALPVRGVGLDVLPGARLLLILTDLERHCRTRPDLLCRMFGLTPSEGEIAVLMAGGLNVAEIAEKRAASLETVRVQIKSVFRKLGVNRQSEVVRLVSRLN